MSVEELRLGLARIAASVVPDEDPYGELMRHARRRRRTRFAGIGAVVAGLLAMAVFGPATGVGSGALDNWLRDPGRGDGYPVTSEWAWRLIESPTRGSLSADRPLIDELTRVFDQDRDESGMAALPKVQVLFADDSTGARRVIVAFYSDTSAALVARTAEVGATPRELVRSGGMSNVPITPFTVLGGSDGTAAGGSRWMLGLAPAGCTVSSAESSTVAADGGLRLAWQPAPTGDYLLLDERRIRGWWRVECEGKVRQQSPVGFGVAEISGRGGAKPPPAGATGGGPLTVGDEVRMAEEAGRSSYRSLVQVAGLPAEPPSVLRWSGRIPGGDGTGASLVAPAAGAGPVVLHVGASSDALVALARPDDATPDDTETLAASRADWALASSAVSTSAELMAVRVPARSGGHAVLTDQLLVVPPADAVRVVAVYPDQPGSQRTSATVTDGAAVLQLPVGLQVTVQALDRDGRVLVSAPLREPARGERLFDEPMLSDW